MLISLSVAVEPVGGSTTKVCAAWPVQCQTYGYGLSGVWSGTTLRSTSICSTVNAVRHNSQCKTYGTTRLRSRTSSTWITDDRRRAAAGLSQPQQPMVYLPGRRASPPFGRYQIVPVSYTHLTLPTKRIV